MLRNGKAKDLIFKVSEMGNKNTFYGKNVNEYSQESINEMAEVARSRGHEIKSRDDLAKIDLEEQGLIYDVWVGGW